MGRVNKRMYDREEKWVYHWDLCRILGIWSERKGGLSKWSAMELGKRLGDWNWRTGKIEKIMYVIPGQGVHLFFISVL